MSRRRMRRPLAERASARVVVGSALAAVLVAGVGIPATAYWTAGTGSTSGGGAVVTAVGTAPVPGASATGQSVALSWTAAQLADGTSLTDYIVRRYASDGTESVVAGGCAGVVRALGCTEAGVPEGVWTYTITGRYATNWIGAEGVKSAGVRVDVTAPTLALTSSAPTGVAWDAASSTVFHDGKSARSVTLTATVADAGSGPDSVTSGALAVTGGASGWSHTPSTVSASSGSATLNPIGIPAGSSSSATLAVTARDRSQNALTATVAIRADVTAPDAPVVTVTRNGDGSYSASVTAGDAAGGSGFQYSDVTAYIRNVSAGTCTGSVLGGPYAFHLTTPTSAFGPFSLNPGTCISYTGTASDRVGNVSVTATGSYIA